MKKPIMIIKIKSMYNSQILDKKFKENSIQFVDFDPIRYEIMSDFKSDREFNNFKYALYEIEQERVDITKTSKWYSLTSTEIEIRENTLAICLPIRIRYKYFRYSKAYQHYTLLPDCRIL